MPDRELTKEELQKFINESAEGEIGFNALKTFNEEKTKPTLHDLCILELYARVEGQTRIIIDMGRKLNLLEEKMKEVEKFMVHNKHEKEFEALRKAFPKLFK